MNGLYEVIETLSKNIGDVDPSDYEKDGLLYCGKCHTKKQTYFNACGKSIKVPCMCQCVQEEKEKANLAFNQEKKECAIQEQKNRMLQDTMLLNATFENDLYPDSKVMRYARRYVDKWEEFYNGHVGLCLYGDAGCGKTFAAACIANALIDKGVSVLMTNFSKIVKGMPDLFNGNQNAYFTDINRNKLLIIDDLGIERDTPYMVEQVYTIIDERYKNKQPVILTTNLSWDRDIVTEKEIGRKRIYDRIKEMCIPLYVEGGSKRDSKNKDKINKARELFKDC